MAKRFWKCFKETLIIHKRDLQKEWGLQLKERPKKFIFVQKSGTYTYMEAQKGFLTDIQKDMYNGMGLTP